jgi:hypothetical protein
MNRRSFLSTLVLGVTGLIGWGFGLLSPHSAPDHTAALVDAIFSNRLNAQRIGQHLLSPGSSDELPGRSVAPSSVPDEAGLRLPPSATVDEIRQQVRRDYAQDKTVCVDGWLLSVTEARLCMWAARSRP